ncbi:MAG: hypothetical protein ABIH70_09960 [Chloroflexota bacterium]
MKKRGSWDEITSNCLFSFGWFKVYWDISHSMKLKRWLKTWGTLAVSLLAVIVSTVAILVSCYATSIENIHYQEVTKPLAVHTEVYNTLTRLDDRIGGAERGIAFLSSQGENVNGYKEKLTEVYLLRDRGESLWVSGNYTEASKFISQAYDILREMPSPTPTPPIPPGTAWFPLIIGIIAGVIIIAVIVLVVTRRKPL